MKGSTKRSNIILLTSLFFSLVLVHVSPVFAGGSGSGTGTGTGSCSGTPQTKLFNAQDLKKYVDKNKDGKVSQEEITISIEEYFDGKSPYELKDLQGLVESFFD